MPQKSLHYLEANQYPEKNYTSRILRAIVSRAPLIGLIVSSSHPSGISVMMRVKNEVDWIRLSIQSIKTIADEIIVVDNGSTDGTYEILEEMASYGKGLIKLWRRPDLDLCSLSNFTLNRATFRWAFRWDGDMVAHTKGEHNIFHLRKRIMSLNPKCYYVIYLRHINLMGDLFHQDPKEMVHIEEYIHTFSSKARYIHPEQFEAIKFPKYYLPLFWYEPYSFHVNVKSSRRMLLRYFWEDWLALKDYQKYPLLENYVEEKMKIKFHTDSWEEAERLCIEATCRNYIPYNSNIFGPYPELLKPYLDNPKYRLKYKNGEIVGRDESST